MTIKELDTVRITANDIVPDGKAMTPREVRVMKAATLLYKPSQSPNRTVLAFYLEISTKQLREVIKGLHDKNLWPYDDFA